MAYDKLVDSKKLDAGLTGIADSIRTKGGTTEPLSFPEGFKEAVNNISAGEPYELPVATDSVLGGVKAKTKSEKDNKEVSVDPNGKLWYSGGEYILPRATATELGGVRAGAKEDTDTQPVNVDGNGMLWTKPAAKSDIPLANTDTLGGVMPVTKTADMAMPVGVDETGRLWAAENPVVVKPTLIVKAEDGSSITVASVSTGETTTKPTDKGQAIFVLNAFDEYNVTGTNAKGEEFISKKIGVFTSKIYETTMRTYSLYGVSWDGTASAKWSRTDDAVGFVDPVPAVSNGTGSSPFDDIMPWSGMVKSVDGNAGTVVAIPKFWYKWGKSGKAMTLQIADRKVPGFFVSPAHMDRGDGKGERDVVYVGRYHCTDDFKSTTGKRPITGISLPNFRNSIHSIGENVFQNDWHIRMTLYMLFLVEFADWDSQTVIGYGCGNNSGIVENGYTDGMKYHTGTTLPSRTQYGASTQYRNIEGIWDNVSIWYDGCHVNKRNNTMAFTNGYPGSPEVNEAGPFVPGPLRQFASEFDIFEAAGFQMALPISYVRDRGYSCAAFHADDYIPGENITAYGSWTQQDFVGIGFCGIVSPSSNAAIGSRLMILP